MTTKQLRDLNAGQNKQASKVHVKLSDRINNSIGRFLVSSKVSKAFKISSVVMGGLDLPY